MMQGLGGLQSLIARGMRNPTQRAPIPPGLQALIQAQQALKQTAAPVTPGGIPTIAGQTEQAIQQQLQPAMPQTPQMGQPQAQVLGQGIPQAAQAAGIAAQQQQAQQQQALQQAMQMAQQQQAQPQPDQTQAQPMAEGGIAQLPADNMARIERYAHGGVLGFSGIKDSEVPDPLETQTSDTALQKIEADKAKNTRDLADKYKQSLGVMSAVASSGDQQAIQKYAASTQENLDALRNYVNTSYGNKADQVLNTVLSSTAPAEEKPTYTYEEPVKAGVPPVAQQRQAAPPVAPPVAPRVTPTAARPASPAAAVPPVGIVAPAAPTPAITPADAIAQAQSTLGGAADLAAYKNLLTQASEARQAIPPQRQAELEQMSKGDVEIAEMRRKAADETAFNRALAVLSGIGRGGIGGAAPAYLGFEQGQQAERAKQIAEDQVRAAARSAIVDAQNARKAGDLDAAAASMAKYQEIVTHRQANVTALANAIMQTEASKESARTHAAATVAAAQIHGLSSIEGAKIHAAVQREGFTKPDSGERLAAIYAELKQTQGEKAADAFLQDRAKVQAVIGGVKYEGLSKEAEHQAKMATEVGRRLKDETGLLSAQLQNPNLDPKKRATIEAQIKTTRDRIRNEVAQEMPAIAGEMTTPAAVAPMYAVNPTTKERIMSTDGGKTWQPAR